MRKMPDTGTYLVDIRFAISAGDLEKIKEIIKQARIQYGNSWTEFNLVMREAVINDKLEILQYFYEMGGDILQYKKELLKLARKFHHNDIFDWINKIINQLSSR